MKRIVLLSLVIFTCFQVMAKPGYNQLWQEANGFYEQKKYDSAAAIYEQLAAGRPESPELYYNLGNTFYKLNKIGPAILNYKRALFYDPAYKQAKDNLALAQSRITNRIQYSPDIFFVKWWKQLSGPALANAWSVIALLLFLTTLLLLLLGRWNKLPAILSGRLVFFSGVLCIGCVYLAYVASQRKVRHDSAVIMIQDTPMRGDMKTSKTQSLIPEGTVVTIEERQQEWVHITLPDGREGWIRSNALEVI